PGIEQIVERFEHFTPIPTCSGQNFCVAVADLQNDRDDRFGGAILDAIEHLEAETAEPKKNHAVGRGISNNPGIEVIRLPRVLSVSGNKPRAAEDKAASDARSYLSKSHADVIIWGTVVQVGDKSAPRIWWTTSEKTQASRNLISFTQSLEL